MYPKGKIIISGHTITQEYDETGAVVKRSIATNHLFQLISHEKEHRIEIVSSASKDCEELLKACCESLLQSKHTHFGIININKADDEYNSRICNANTIILIGEPSEIYSFFCAGFLTELVYSTYLTDENFTLIGINTAAMALSDLMIGTKKAEAGLGLIKNCFINLPFGNHSDFKKLIKTVLSHQNYLGVNINGDMSITIERGFKTLCKGTGSVMIINAREVSSKSLKPFKRGASLYVKNLKGQILVDGSRVDLRTGNIIKPDKFDFNLNFTNRNSII